MTDSRNTTPAPDAESVEHDQATVVKLIIAWLWVGIPAVWGIWHVFLTSLNLFR